MTANAPACLPWERAFLAGLRKGRSIAEAAAAAGIAPGTAYSFRRSNARFAAAWEAAFEAGGRTPRGQRFTRVLQWKRAFLEALAETSNVSASAARVNVPTRTVYRLKREDPEFAARWLAALREGFDNLQMELLGYLRDPQPKRKMDVAAALRLLSAHREAVERERALRDDDDEQAVLDSIDAFLEDMRQRRLANAAILLEAESDDGPD
jgi:AcrR family transcriptional regulator